MDCRGSFINTWCINLAIGLWKQFRKGEREIQPTLESKTHVVLYHINVKKMRDDINLIYNICIQVMLHLEPGNNLRINTIEDHLSTRLDSFMLPLHTLDGKLPDCKNCIQ